MVNRPVHEPCMKNVRIRIYSGPYFPAFELNTDRYSVSLRIQLKCGKIRARITPNTDIFTQWKSSSLMTKIQELNK